MEALILFFLLTLITSFTCSLLESVILSVTHTHVEYLKKQGRESGKVLHKLKRNIDVPLAAVLTLNTIANTAGSAAVGVRVHNIYGSDYVAVASGILTFCILIFSEIIPKTLGASYWKNLAPLAAYSIQFLVYILYPFVIFSKFITQRFGVHRPLRITREDMILSAELGQIEGSLQRKETRIIKNLLKLHSIFVSDILTPRSVMFSLPKNLTVKEVMDQYAPLRFSRIPIYNKNLDDIMGIVLRFDLMEAYRKGGGKKELAEFIKPLTRIQESETVAEALDDFVQEREHIFLCQNEFKQVTGIVSLEDTVETLLGVEIVDETDSVDDMRKLALEKWKERRKTMP